MRTESVTSLLGMQGVAITRIEHTHNRATGSCLAIQYFEACGGDLVHLARLKKKTDRLLFLQLP